MLSFEDLEAGNWDKYGNSILGSESVFPEAIRTDKEDFFEVVKEHDAVAKVALLDSNYAGNVFGHCIPPDDFGYYGLHDIPANAKVIYLFNIVINPEYQSRGYGHQLLWEFIKAAKAKGYDYVAGHFRQNGSLHLIKRMGAKEEGVVRNWENMGEDCVACCLDIHSIPEPQPSGIAPSGGLLPVASAPEPNACISPVPSDVLPEMHDVQHFDAEPPMNEPSFPEPCTHL